MALGHEPSAVLNVLSAGVAAASTLFLAHSLGRPALRTSGDTSAAALEARYVTGLRNCLGALTWFWVVILALHLARQWNIDPYPIGVRIF